MTNKQSETMGATITPVKVYDLEDRTFEFAVHCRNIVKTLLKTTANMEYGKQLVRSSGSVGANYIEANESLSKKDFVMRVKIARKEVKESRYWLRLLEVNDQTSKSEQAKMINEATELLKILDSIARKAS